MDTVDIMGYVRRIRFDCSIPAWVKHFEWRMSCLLLVLTIILFDIAFDLLPLPFYFSVGEDGRRLRRSHNIRSGVRHVELRMTQGKAVNCLGCAFRWRT